LNIPNPSYPYLIIIDCKHSSYQTELPDSLAGINAFFLFHLFFMTVLCTFFLSASLTGVAENFFNFPSFHVAFEGDYTLPVYAKLHLTYPPRSPMIPALCRSAFHWHR
jgi:hypothetical protein